MNTDEVIVEVVPIPVLMTSPDEVICSGNSITLLATGADTYNWWPASYLNSPTSASPVASPLLTTTFTVAGSVSGCSDTAAIAITVIPGITVQSTSASICSLGSVTLEASNADTYSWTPDPTLSSGLGSSVTASPTVTTTYTVTGYSQNGCSDTNLSVVTVNHVNISVADQTICENDHVLLIASGATQYSWSPLIGLSSGFGTNVLASPLSTTTYTISGTNNGCSNVAYSIVKVNSNPVADFSSSVLEGCPGTCASFINQSSGAVAGSEWEFGNEKSSILSSPEVCFEDSGSYDVSLIVTSYDGCKDTISKIHLIRIYDKPVAEFTTEGGSLSVLDPRLCVENTSLRASSFTWLYDSFQTSWTNEVNPCFVYPDTGRYCIQLTAQNDFGCVDTAEHCISIFEEPVIYFPNSFTPGGDGLNDVFSPVGVDVSEYQIWIYNRWGELVFYSNDFSVKWNGRSVNSGKLVPQDVYVWKSKYMTDKFRTVKGTVTVIY